MTIQEDDNGELVQREAEILRRLNARKGRRSGQNQAPASAAACDVQHGRTSSGSPATPGRVGPLSDDDTCDGAEPAEQADSQGRTAAGQADSQGPASAEQADSQGRTAATEQADSQDVAAIEQAESQDLASAEARRDESETSSDGRHDAGKDADFTVLEEVERAGRRTVHRILPDWLARPDQIGERRPTPEEVAELAPELRLRLRQLGVERLFPVQAAVLPPLLAAADSPLPPADLCVSAPTGSGKTLAFVLPLVQTLSGAVVRRVRALVVLPTQALAAQVAAVFRQYAAGLPLSVRLLGIDTLARERRRLVEPGPRGALSLADIVVSTPGRLMDHLSGTEGFSLAHLRYLVIDEADRVMEMAETGWLQAVERAAAAADGPPRRPAGPSSAVALASPHLPLQKLLFSATLSQNPEKLERLRLFQPRLLVWDSEAVPRPGQFVGKFTTPAELQESFIVCAPQLKPLLLHHLLRQAHWRRVLIFTNSNESAHRLTLLLDSLGGPAVAEFSGGVPAARRRRALAALTAGQLSALVCSDAMARGMDVEAVSAVVSYDIPALVKTYVHRVGRTARAGQPGEAVTLLLERQRGHFQRLLAQVGKQERVPERPPCLDELRQYEAAYVKALELVMERVEEEKKEQACRLHGWSARADDAAGKRRKRTRKRKLSAVEASG
ncbi:ATP-dependent RNA helicase DDX51-like [Pollicipes pollicipes]|uniref:ATP-dependent RNA helicase DDX51-like n=1 Tax=Pollicipes pollicipes TaxID=41117 RepID=UPI00188535E3|nr:ATP-dependent RNA helicase DDX51-like [Pollicipes pollicipes]XP_037072810.1 ATP-dependent RNA helicase DDX51-like [Pollicipes pollicipes]